MRLEANLYGLYNKEELGQAYIFDKNLSIENIKEMHITLLNEEISTYLKDIEQSKKRLDMDEKMIEELKDFIVKQYKTTHIYKVKEIKENSIEIEIIELNIEEKIKKANKEIKEILKEK